MSTPQTYQQELDRKRRQKDEETIIRLRHELMLEKAKNGTLTQMNRLLGNALRKEKQIKREAAEVL